VDDEDLYQGWYQKDDDEISDNPPETEEPKTGVVAGDALPAPEAGTPATAEKPDAGEHGAQEMEDEKLKRKPGQHWDPDGQGQQEEKDDDDLGTSAKKLKAGGGQMLLPTAEQIVKDLQEAALQRAALTERPGEASTPGASSSAAAAGATQCSG
jgi:hypothetical protein